MKTTNIAAILALFLASQAEAQIYVLKASADISHIALLYDEVSQPVVPTGRFAVGDKFNLNVMFDTERAVVANLFDADPTINMYSLNNLSVSIRAGSYRSQFTGNVYDRFLSLWDNRNVSGRHVDSQSFTLDQFDILGAVPFELGSGRNLEMITLHAFDSSALSRKSDLINELVESSKYFSNSLTYSYSIGPAGGDRYQIVALTSNVNWTLTPRGVPEPTTWTMFLSGFLMTGMAVRRGRLSSRSKGQAA